MNPLERIWLIGTAALMTGCATPARKLGEFLPYPVDPNYKITDIPMSEKLPLDMKMVYVQKCQSSPEDEGFFTFIRFWPDGRCFVSSIAYPSLNLKIVDTLEGGEAGYFRIEGDRIYIETFSFEWSGSYCLRQGILVTNEQGQICFRILEERYRGGFSLSLVPRVYRYPHFGLPRSIHSDFEPVDFGPLKSEPMWPVDPKSGR